MKRVVTALFVLSVLSATFVGFSDAQAVISSARELTQAMTSHPSEWKSYENRPFDLTCSIIAVTHGIVFADETGRSRANILPSIPHPSAGDLVRISGIVELTQMGRITPLCTSLRVVGKGRLPDPTDVDGPEFASGRCDFQLVRVEGSVLDVIPDAVDSNYDMMILVCDQERIICPTMRGAAERFLGRRVEVVGVCIPAPPMSRQMIGRILSATKPIRCMDDRAEDCFDAPELINSRFRQPRDLSCLGRRKVRGTVLAVWRRGALVGTDENLVARLEFCGDGRPVCGDVIEASGLPETDVFSPILRRARWRKIASKGGTVQGEVIDVPFSSLYSPADFNADASPPNQVHKSILLHGKAIRTTAKVRSLPSSSGLVDYMLVGTDELSIPVDINSAMPRPRGLVVGSTVEISGIYMLECQPWRANAPVPPIKDIRIIVRSADDIQVVATPSWWTARRLLIVIGILAAVLMLVIIWNIALQRLAERRGQRLSDERIARAEAEIKTMERTRLAAELHDTISQNLTGVSIAIDAARQFCDSPRPELTKQLDVADATLDACQTELRNCLWDLRSRTLEEADLNTAIRTALLPHVSDAALEVRFNVSRDRLTENTTHTILKIVRELVINAVRHGHATRILVAGVMERDALRFSVRDNGCGFDAASCPGVAQNHFGLQGIRERLSPLSGEISFESSAGSGTKAVVSIPLSIHQNPLKAT